MKSRGKRQRDLNPLADTIKARAEAERHARRRAVESQKKLGVQLTALLAVLQGNPRFDRLIELRHTMAKVGIEFPGGSRIAEIVEELHAAFEYCEAREFDLVPELEGLISSYHGKAGLPLWRRAKARSRSRREETKGTRRAPSSIDSGDRAPGLD